jgi:Flp pilus assembly protein TadG
MKRSSSRRRCSGGQALIEFALVLPLLALLVINVVNFGGMLYAWVTVSNAARAGADYLMMGASYYSVASPAFSTVAARVADDLTPLPNAGTAHVKVCTYNSSSTATCTGTGGFTPPADPETSCPGCYTVGTVDVTYTYTPYISIWNFQRLGISLTTLPTSIHRQAVVRMIGN